jgi:DNA helicase-2/ATP-dependent DNA helicase PcrA
LHDLLTSLNSPQKEAVTSTEGPLLVLAGAGSGKTRVLTHRLAYLIKEKEVSPANILAITFTNKAANEMRARLVTLIGTLANEVWVSTFHAACVRILRRDIKTLGYSSNYVIYDQGDQLTVIRHCLRELNIDEKKYPPRTVNTVISQAKNNLLEPEQYDQIAANLFEKKIAGIYRLYQQKLKEHNALDFDDLLGQTVRLLLKNPVLLAYYQRKFKYILVDEYQDTNHAQYALVNLLAQQHHNLCVVGDDDQSIYGWRGADIRNILAFENDYPEAKIIKLEQNYRSTGNILQAANEVIKHNQGRKAKRLWTQQAAGPPLVSYESEDGYTEARFVAGEILRLYQSGQFPYASFAILYRTHAQSRVFEEIFMREGLPYQIIGGLEFYERKEIKDIIAYLRFIYNPMDNLSLQRIINVPTRGIGGITWLKLESYAAERQLSIYGAIQEASQIPGLASRSIKLLGQFMQIIDKFLHLLDKIPVTDLVQEILTETGYWQILQNENTPEAETRLENIKEFLSVTRDFDRESSLHGLGEFLTQVSLIADLDHYQGSEAVSLMTLHTAKGLEYPVIFLVGMEDGIFPSSRSFMEPSKLEEERRLCYVGMTRAKQMLYLTHARTRMLYGNVVNNPPSRFLLEIPEEYFSETIKESAPVPDTSQSFQLGEQVYHNRWGKGVVVRIKGSGTDTEVSVAFPQLGIKHLLLAYAPLKKV